MEDIQNLRQKLDRIDGEIVALLEERLETARRIADWKAERNLPVLDEAREKQVLADRCARLKEEELRVYLKPVFADIMAMSRAAQESRIAQAKHTEDNNV